MEGPFSRRHCSASRTIIEECRPLADCLAFMLDMRTNMAKHTRALGLWFAGLVVFALLLEILG